MDKKFDPGNIVKLKSGGPEITIEDYHRNVYNREIIPDKYVCVWIDDNKKEHREIYPAHVLEFIRK